MRRLQRITGNSASHLSDVAKAVHNADAALAEVWTALRHDELDAGRVDAVLAALRDNTPTCEEACKCRESVRTNRHRMRYKDSWERRSSSN